MEKKRPVIIDLSIPLANFAMEDPAPSSIVYYSHRDWARMQARNHGLSPDDFPDGLGLAREVVTANTHCGTHIDSPYHYGPTSEGKPAKTIDQVPLDWFYGDGVLLDFRQHPSGIEISPDDLKRKIDEIEYTLQPYDIVLVWTGTDERKDPKPFWERHVGVSRDGTEWLLDQGIKLVGTDAFGWDNPFSNMIGAYKAGKTDSLWPSHFFGREREYCQIEKLGNLDKLPKPTGFKIAVFPILIERASAGWCRAVAILQQ